MKSVMYLKLVRGAFDMYHVIEACIVVYLGREASSRDTLFQALHLT